jgi:hypothetical protein
MILAGAVLVGCSGSVMLGASGSTSGGSTTSASTTNASTTGSSSSAGSGGSVSTGSSSSSGGGATSETCEALEMAAEQQLEAVVKQNLSCSVDADCVEINVAPSGWCAAHCGVLTDESGAPAVQSAATSACEPFLVAASEPLGRTVLRDKMRVRNERLGEALARLATRGAIVRVGDRWAVPVPSPAA